MRGAPLAGFIHDLARRVAYAVGVLSCATFSIAQQTPALLLTPSTAAVAVGEKRTLRPVDAQGRLRTGVTWSVTPTGPVSYKEGEEIEISAENPGSVTIAAQADGQTGTATVTVSRGPIPEGTARWRLAPLPGNRLVKFTPAQPSSPGPSLYAIERGSGGSVIRALSADGRELWRTAMGGDLDRLPLATPPTKRDGTTEAPKPAKRPSVCNDLAVGMHRDEALARVRSRGLAPSSSRSSNRWEIEQPGVTCVVKFDSVSNKIAGKKQVFTSP